LSHVHADSKFCWVFRAVYHQCYWCITNDDDDNDDNTTVILPPTIEEYCTIDCFNVSQVDPDAFMEVHDMKVMCQELSSILEQKQSPATIYLCESYQQMGHLCPELECSNSSYKSYKICFSEENFPTCEMDPLAFSENDFVVSVDYVQHTCFTLASEYLIHMDEWNVSLHAKVLTIIRLELDLCHDVKQVYPLCHWCLQDAMVSDCSIPNCFTLNPLCVIDSLVNVISTYQELTDVLQKEELLSTTNLCYKLSQVSHLCPAVCANYNYQLEEGCFTAENPPSCSPPGNDESSILEVDEQEICHTLFVDYMDNNGVTFKTSAHLSILSKIPVHSKLCAAAQSMYHCCFWCAPYAAQGVCSQQPPHMPYCSAPLTLLHANVHYHEICAKLEYVFANYSATGPMTINLCQGLEWYSHICPNLCIYIAGWNGDAIEDDDESTGIPPELCFKKDQDLPNCFATTIKPNNNTMVMDEEDVQHLCFLLDGGNDFSAITHEDILPNILANSELCHATQHTFHLCHWCSPSTMPCQGSTVLCSPNLLTEIVDDDLEEALKLAAACMQLKALHSKRE